MKSKEVVPPNPVQTADIPVEKASLPTGNQTARIYRKRARFKLPPRPPVPVRSLWEAAGQVERERAHKTAIAILEHWLGRASRQQVAEKLGTAPLRVWQLSQQAVFGMVAGLLKQPKARKGAGVMVMSPEDDPKVLRKEIQALKQENAALKSLIEVLKQIPGIKPKIVNVPSRKRKGKKADRSQAAGKPRKEATGETVQIPAEGDAAGGNVPGGAGETEAG